MLDFVNGGQNQAYLCDSFLASHWTLRFRLGPVFGLPSTNGTKWRGKTATVRMLTELITLSGFHTSPGPPS
jgi:hypothetical protein